MRHLAEIEHGVSIEYETLGTSRTDRRPLVLARPMLGDLTMWGEFSRELAADREVISYNPRGVGRSHGPWLGITTSALAGDVLRLADHLALASFDIAGLSLGGMVASHVALAAPARVGHLVLISAVARGRDIPARRLLHLLPSPSNPPSSVADAEAGALGDLFSAPFWRRAPQRAVAAMRGILARPTSFSHLLASAFAAYRHDVSRDLAHLDVPTLLVFGNRDRLLKGAARDRLSDALPHAERYGVAECGHDVSLERPRELAHIIDRFLERE